MVNKSVERTAVRVLFDFGSVSAAVAHFGVQPMSRSTLSRLGKVVMHLTATL